MDSRRLLPLVFAVVGACSRAPAQEVDAAIVAPSAAPAPAFVPSPPLESLDASVTPAFDSRPGPATPITFTDPAGEALFAFGVDLYGALGVATWREGSFVLSPLSFAGALSMAHAGARGETADEIGRAMYLSPRVSGPSLPALERSFATRSAALFASSEVSKSYRDTIERDFFGEVIALDFARDPAGARARIDRWALDKTAGKLPKLLDAGAIDGLTALVLVDALYAAGTWARPFPLDQTAPKPFERASGASVVVPTMASRAERRAWHEVSYDAVEIACDREHALVVIAPAKGSLAAFERALTAPRLRQILGQLAPHDVELTLPRFSVRSHVDPRAALRALGVRRALSREEADFSAMTPSSTYIGKVAHGAGIDVDERGVKTVAATAVVMQKAAPRPPPLALHVDRPFVFVLMNTQTGAPIVMGRYAGP